MNLITKNPPPLPIYDVNRAHEVIDEVDSILRWERRTEKERDSRFVELGEHLCEIRAGQYWRAEQLKSFEDFLAKRFPDSRRKAYYLMSIHENLEPQISRKVLRQLGWSKAAELVKVARSDRDRFDCATWLHKAEQLPKEEFKAQVESHLTGKETEISEVIYFKLYKSQIPVVEEAIETAAMLIGADRSRGYCLEMICADFLSGARHNNRDWQLMMRNGCYVSSRQLMRGNRLPTTEYQQLRIKVLERDRWCWQLCGARTDLQVHHTTPRAQGGADSESNLITLCFVCHRRFHSP